MSEQAVAQQQTNAKSVDPSNGLMVQRKCACGQHTVAGGECEACRKKRLNLQRWRKDKAGPALMTEMTAHSGSAPAGLMQPRFGHDFTQVRLRTTKPLLQRQPQGEEVIAPEVMAEPTTEPAAPGETAATGLLVEDDTTDLGEGQMRKSEFLAELRPAVCAAADAELAAAGRDTEGCPYLDYWFDFHGQRDAGHIERALSRYAPQARTATSARDYIPIVTERVRQGVARWVSTGEVSGVPEGVPTSLPGAGPAGAETGPGTGGGNGAIQRKAKAGSAKQEDDPAAIRDQLGSGRALDSGVRSRMESAFGTGFGHVRLHDDGNAANLSSRQSARAFTVGEHVAFGAGEYRPGTLLGDALIAHELAHVVQQSDANESVGNMTTDDTGYGALEHDADQTATRAIVSLWNGKVSTLANITQNAMPSLRSGLRLQRCGSDVESPEFGELLSSENKKTLEKYNDLLEKGEINPSDEADVNEKIKRAEELAKKVRELEGSESDTPIVAGTTATLGRGLATKPNPYLIIAGLALIVGAALFSGNPASKEAAKEAEQAVREAMDAIIKATRKTKPKPEKKPDPKTKPEKTTDPVLPVVREPKDKDPKEANTMRFQIQWDTKNKGPTFSEVATAPSATGVTTTQAVAALNTVVVKVEPKKAREAAEPAAAQQRKWINSRPPAGIATAGYSKSVYFAYKSYTDARVDVENLRGHNLKT